MVMVKIARKFDALFAERILLAYGALAAVALLIGFMVGEGADLTAFYLARQDRWLLLIGMALLSAAALAQREWSSPLRASWKAALATGCAMAALAFAGHYLVLSGFDLSRDEQMASFDASIFARGQLVAPLPLFWRDHSDALRTLFMYPAEHRAAWVSTYLPLNALIRAGWGLVATPALSGPVMVLIGAIALWGCTRRIWPNDRETGAVALLLYMGSGQILLSGMTSYAMPGHLALNLTWLWFFLRRAWWADLAAVATAFVAIGLHQPLMHPMFAAPLLLLLLIERDWRRAAFYALCYGLICAFWLWWPGEMWRLSQANLNAPQQDGVDYLTRLVQSLKNTDRRSVRFMISNMARLVAWQPLLLLPLLSLAMPAIRRDRLAAALAGGCVITIVVMAVALPFQGHGFGYRYLHGLLGNLFLLAIYGWKDIRSGLARWRGVLIATTVAGLSAILPVQLAMAHAFYHSWAVVSNRIDQVKADYVVIGDDDVSLSGNLVFNRPALDGRPIRLLREEIDPALAQKLCATHPRVSMVTDQFLSPIRRYFRMGAIWHPAAIGNGKLMPVLTNAGCLVTTLN
jgi:hypothetical protein